MGIRINNSSFKLNNSTFKGGNISTAITLSMGSIYRVVNYGGITDSLSYTKIDGTIVSTGNIASGSFVYILALSGSLTDSTFQGGLNQLAITNLLITSSVDETPTFTEELITTTGAGTWTKPLGVTQVIVECWGGGGAGGGATTNGQLGSGGASGGFARKLIIYNAAQSGKSYSVAASVAGTTGNGATGNDTTWETNVVVAKGGGGGLANDLNGSGGGLPGSPNVGDIVYEGILGANAFTSRGGEVSGNGGTHPGSVGLLETEYGGPGGVSTGVGGAGANINGFPGGNYGGGGSGASKDSNPNKSGGAGAQGLIRIIYR